MMIKGVGMKNIFRQKIFSARPLLAISMVKKSEDKARSPTISAKGRDDAIIFRNCQA
jgi:hypothetical protein